LHIFDFKEVEDIMAERVGFEMAAPQTIDSLEHTKLSSIVSVPNL
jgi:hypothetical protein